jgi:hypothetical protein
VDKPRALLDKRAESMTEPLQSVFPLQVAVCAWCKPKGGGVYLGDSLGLISHGICPRHLKKLKLELQRQKDAGQPAQATAAHSQRPRAVSGHPELNYPA